MRNTVKELTEGMQRLCAIANQVVAAEGRLSAIERDLLLEALRSLYDISLRLEVHGTAAQPSAAAEPVAEEEAAMPDDELISSTVMATMAAMGVAQPAEASAASEPEPEPEPEPVAEAAEPKPVAEPEPVAEAAEPEPKPEPVAAPEPEPVSMSAFESDGGMLFEEIVVEPEPAAAEPEPAPEPAAAEPEPAPEPAVEPEPAPAQEPAREQASLLDYLRHPAQEQPVTRTLGESLGGARAVESGFERSMSRKVDDLRTVININDKFSFMSELFKNNMRAYNDFIMYLNSLTSRDEALAYVRETAAQYKWDEESLAVKSFYKVFDMKF